MTPDERADLVMAATVEVNNNDGLRAVIAEHFRIAITQARAEMREEAARVAEEHSLQTEIERSVYRKQKGPQWDNHVHALRIAAAIRALEA